MLANAATINDLKKQVITIMMHNKTNSTVAEICDDVKKIHDIIVAINKLEVL